MDRRQTSARSECARTAQTVRTVDVVIVTYNSARHVARCIEGLRDVPGLRLIVIDNQSRDDTLAALAALGVEPIVSSENVGFARASNMGWRTGHGEFVLFLNPDAVLTAGSLEVMLETIMSDSDIGMVGPCFVYGDGSLALYQRRFPTLPRVIGEASGLDRLLPTRCWTGEIVRDPAAYAHSTDVDWMPGACLLIRRTTLELLDGFDEAFFMYCEDIDLCRRIAAAGLRVRYEAGSVCVHAGSGSAPRVSLLPTLVRSRVLYARKHSSPLVAATTAAVLRGGALARAALGDQDRRRAQLQAAVTRL